MKIMILISSEIMCHGLNFVLALLFYHDIDLHRLIWF